MNAQSEHGRFAPFTRWAFLKSLLAAGAILMILAWIPPLRSQDLKPIEIKLPKPVFTGTPQNISVPNLEKSSGNLRPPFLAPSGTRNLALGKPVTSSDSEPVIGDLGMITDGDKEASEGSFVELGPFLQYVTIDLLKPAVMFAVVVWHYHQQPVVYKDVVIQVSDDGAFRKNVRTLFNNDHDNTSKLGAGTDKNYVETAEGKLINARGVVARYVRLYSRGNSSDDMNHYIEVDVYGKPVP
jgi:hypothetical protein